MTSPHPVPVLVPGPVPAPTPVVVLGGSGYVAGELLRLLAGHPVLHPAAVVSANHAGEAAEKVFPHLAGCLPGLVLQPPEAIARLVGEAPRLAAFSAAPHGASAPLVGALLAAAERSGCELSLVDLSADFRFATPEAYAEVYGRPHPAPGRLAAFRCALPEHAPPGAPRAEGGLVAHPGCFTTAVLLAAVPLLALELVEPRLSAVAVTGSTGAGRSPGASTHHPERRSNLFAYSPLAHRHQPEMKALARQASGMAAEISFVPQAGPFARGIYATLQGRLLRPAPAEELAAALAGFYAGAPFVRVAVEPPRLQSVVGTNRCQLGVAAAGDDVVVFSALDNLVKGAAGGAVQWMNRLLGLAETAGLELPGLGWL